MLPVFFILLGTAISLLFVYLGIYNWRKGDNLEATIMIMVSLSIGYLTIFLPMIVYLWPLEEYGEPSFFKPSFALFIINTISAGILTILYLLNYIEGSIDTEKWNGD